MVKRITIQPDLSVEELEGRYRQATDGIERSHYQIIWLLAQGKPTQEVAKITGYSRSWLYEVVWGYNRLGADCLGDKRHAIRIRGDNLWSMTWNKPNCGKYCSNLLLMEDYGTDQKWLLG